MTHLHMVQSTHRCTQRQISVSHYLCSHILSYPWVAGSARQQLFANALENDLDWSCASTPRLLKNQERRSTRSSGEFCSTKLICSQTSQRGSADSRPPSTDVTLASTAMFITYYIIAPAKGPSLTSGWFPKDRPAYM